MAKVDMMITVQTEKQGQLEQVAKSLEHRGFQVQKTYPRSGTIRGSGDISLLESLKSVSGIEDVRQERRYQLPPMSDDIPQ